VPIFGFSENYSQKKEGLSFLRKIPWMPSLPNRFDLLRHTDQCSRQHPGFVTAPLKRAETASRMPESNRDKCLRVMNVTTVYRYPSSSTPETLHRFLSLRIAPWLPDTDSFEGIAPDKTSETPQHSSHDQAFLPDLIPPGFL